MTQQTDRDVVLFVAGELERLIEEALTTVFDVEPAPVPSSVERLAAAVAITGTWNGTLVIDTGLETARAVAAGMLDVPRGDVEVDEVGDALGEFANIIGGGFKAMLPEPTTISVPTVTHGLDFRVRVPGGTLLRHATAQFAGDAFEVELWQA